MPGFDNNTVYADNVDFRGVKPVVPQVTTDGQLLIGSTAAPHIKVGSLTGSNGITITPGSGTINIAGMGTFAEQQIIYVGKHGNDANAGTNISTAVLTFTQALVLTAAATPSATNRYAIVCLDDGIYAESITTQSYVDIYAPNAQIDGAIIGVDDSYLKLRAQIIPGFGTGVSKPAGAGTFFCEIDYQTTTLGFYGFNCESGTMNIVFKEIRVPNGRGIANIATAQGNYNIMGGKILITNTGAGIEAGGVATISGYVNEIIDTGLAFAAVANQSATSTINLEVKQIKTASGILCFEGTSNITVQNLICTTAYNISAGALNLFYNVLSGTRTQTGGTLRLWRPPTVMTNGQLVIGSTGADPVSAALTAGTGIGITNAAGSITVNAKGAGLTWTTVGASTALLINNGFVCTAGAALSFSLPATSAVGDTVAITLDGSTSWAITQAANQSIRIGALATTIGVGGSLTSTAQGDTLLMVCSVANLKWNVISAVGNITVV